MLHAYTAPNCPWYINIYYILLIWSASNYLWVLQMACGHSSWRHAPMDGIQQPLRLTDRLPPDFSAHQIWMNQNSGQAVKLTMSWDPIITKSQHDDNNMGARRLKGEKNRLTFLMSSHVVLRRVKLFSLFFSSPHICYISTRWLYKTDHSLDLYIRRATHNWIFLRGNIFYLLHTLPHDLQ